MEEQRARQPQGQPKYILQIVLGRGSDRDVCFLDVRAWSWFDPKVLGEIITESILLCPDCHGPTYEGMCAHCHVLHEREDAAEGISIQANPSRAAVHLAEIYERFSLDADLLLFHFPTGVESCVDLRGISTRPLDEIFAQAEARVYTREAVVKDAAAGIPLAKALEGFLHA